MNSDIIKALGVFGLTDQWGNEIYHPRPYAYWKVDPPRKCALPGCEKMTIRGYCCAAHCKAHKQQLRLKRSA